MAKWWLSRLAFPLLCDLLLGLSRCLFKYVGCLYRRAGHQCERCSNVPRKEARPRLAAELSMEASL